MLKLHCTWIFTVTSHWKYTCTFLQWMKQSKKSIKILAQSSSNLCSQIGNLWNNLSEPLLFQSSSSSLVPTWNCRSLLFRMFLGVTVIYVLVRFVEDLQVQSLVQLLRDDTFRWIIAVSVLCVSCFINVAATCRLFHVNCWLLVKSKLEQPVDFIFIWLLFNWFSACIHKL